MAARCSSCDLNLPNDKKRCPGCLGPTWKMEGEPHDPEWDVKTSRRRKLVRRDFKDRIPTVYCEIVEQDGQLFVADENLQDYGYIGLVTGDIVKINDEYYECSAAVYVNSDCPGWWLQFIPIDGVFTDASSEEIKAALVAAQETSS